MEIPDNTIEAFARNFHREARNYGFQDADCLRFVNVFLDLVMKNERNGSDQLNVLNWSRSSEHYAKLPINEAQLCIREYDDSTDKPYFTDWLSDEYGRYFLISRLSLHRTEFHDLVNDPTNIIGTITLPDGLPIGGVAFLKHDRISKKAELRKMVGNQEYRGKGFAKLATRLWIEYGLFGLGLKKIYLNTLNTNIRNIRINEELGFKVEGMLHNEVFIDGVFQDVLRMSLWLE